jgi:hypothetical protein
MPDDSADRGRARKSSIPLGRGTAASYSASWVRYCSSEQSQRSVRDFGSSNNNLYYRDEVKSIGRWPQQSVRFD